MKMALLLVEVKRPPGFRHSNHMLMQNPPSRQPNPSVKSWKINEHPPNTTPVKNIATRYAPCIEFLIGGFMT